MGKELALLENNDMGKQVRRQLLAMERTLREDVPAVIRRLEAERDAARQCLLLSNPLWGRAWHYRELGLTTAETGRLLDKSLSTMEKLFKKMKMAGLPLPAPAMSGPKAKALVMKGGAA
jgi:hypothetical protein